MKKGEKRKRGKKKEENREIGEHGKRERRKMIAG